MMLRARSWKIRGFSFLICLSMLLSFGDLFAFSVCATENDVMPQVSVGSSFVVALNASGSLFLWGSGDMIGAGASDSDTPVPLSVPNVTFVSVSAGTDHALALSADGHVYVWGSDNSYGQLGKTGSDSLYTPTKVDLPTEAERAVAVSAGDRFSLVLTADGTVYAWGANDKGQLGVALPQNAQFTHVPTPISGVTATQIRAAEKSALAIAHDGSLWLWGSVDEQGLIDPNGSNPYLPVQKVLTGHFAYRAAMGKSHLSFVTLNGELYSYGSNAKGQFGNSETDALFSLQYALADVVTDENVSLKIEDVAFGSEHTAVLTDSGLVYTWGGSNSCGELGYDLERSVAHTPVMVDIPVEQDDRIVGISAKNKRTAAVDNSGFVWVWGSRWDGSDVKYDTPTVVMTANETRFCLGTAPMTTVYSTSVTACATVPAPTYAVSIPASMDLGDLRQRDGTDATRIHETSFTVSVSDVDHLFGEKQIKISVSGDGGAFLLTDGNYTLPYEVFAEASDETPLSSGDVFAAFSADGQATGCIRIDQSLITRRGDYTGRLVFSFAVEALPEQE